MAPNTLTVTKKVWVSTAGNSEPVNSKIGLFALMGWINPCNKSLEERQMEVADGISALIDTGRVQWEWNEWEREERTIVEEDEWKSRGSGVAAMEILKRVELWPFVWAAVSIFLSHFFLSTIIKIRGKLLNLQIIYK